MVIFNSYVTNYQRVVEWKTGWKGQNLRVPGPLIPLIKLHKNSRGHTHSSDQNDESNILYLRLQLGATVPLAKLWALQKNVWHSADQPARKHPISNIIQP